MGKHWKLNFLEIVGHGHVDNIINNIDGVENIDDGDDVGCIIVNAM